MLTPELAVSQGIAALSRAAPHTQRTDCRWAALLADLPEARARGRANDSKPQAPIRCWPRGSVAGDSKIKTALKDATECMNLLKTLDALRREEPFEGFCEALVALEQNSVDAQKAIELLQRARAAAQKVKAADFADQGLTGPELGVAIQVAQIEAIAGAA